MDGIDRIGSGYSKKFVARFSFEVFP